MDMLTWAEKEVELACARERAGSSEEGEWDYGCACYESALKAFKCLMEDGHSGMSIGVTKSILNRLIDGSPLTPIEDTDDIWNQCYRDSERGYDTYQCKRMSSLFKDVYPDGTIKYSDVDRIVCVSRDNPKCTYRSGLVRRILDEMFPITMPYCGESMKVVCEDFLVDPKNGDFDTVGILYILNKDGSKDYFSRYFKEGEDDWIEIDVAEYIARMEAAKKREANEE